MRVRIAAFLVVASSLLASPLQAQQDHFTFVNGGSFTAFGYYVGTYQGTEGTGASATKVLLNCVDFFHEVTNGEQWDANLTNLGGSSVGSATRLSDRVGLAVSNPQHLTNGDALTLYREAAWLTTQYAGQTNASVVGDIQATIWTLFGYPDPNHHLPVASSTYWLTQAQSNYQTLDYSSFYVVTDVNKANSNSVQEFIVHTTATPEPATFTLFGTGLIGLLGAAVRRRKRSNAAGRNIC